MKGDVRWKSTNRQFGTPGPSVYDTLNAGRGPGRGWGVGSQWKPLDRSSRYVMWIMSLFAFVMLMAVDGLLALLWLCAAGPLALGFALIIANAGGLVWCRLVTTGYTACVLIGLGWAMVFH